MITDQLIKDAQQGKRRAQSELYRGCFSLLMGTCLRYKKDRDDAAAMLNEGYFKILKNLAKKPASTPFEPWAKRIMINTLIDDFRKNRKVRELIEHTDFQETDTFDTAVDWNIADRELDADELRAMIRKLPPVSQKVFNLYAVDGYAHREIGELLGMSENTSKWHLSSSRKKLQEMILQQTKTASITLKSKRYE